MYFAPYVYGDTMVHGREGKESECATESVSVSERVRDRDLYVLLCSIFHGRMYQKERESERERERERERVRERESEKERLLVCFSRE